MTEVYLIGTYHFDVNGPFRLERVLEEVHPEFILLEGNESRDKTRQVYKKFLNSELKVKKVDQALVEAVLEKAQRLLGGYESKVAIQFASSHQISVEYFNDIVDHFSLQKCKIEARTYIRSLINGKVTTKKIFDELRNSQRSCDQKWELLKSIEGTESESVFILSNSDNPDITRVYDPKRNIIMEKVLRDYVLSGQYRRIATITGFSHIVDDSSERTLYSRIKDIHPIRKFLY